MERASSLGKIEGPSAARHGGDLARAMALHGGAREEWLDLSTGINAAPYPVRPPGPGAAVWRDLPDADAAHRAAEAARIAYRAAPEAAVLATPGAQGAIQALPGLLKDEAGAQPLVAILGPTYAEHARAFSAAGWWVEPVREPEAAEGAAAAVVVNPNNPDGRAFGPEELLNLAARVGRLIVDESFMDETPERSLAGACAGERLVVLRSLGKFYGLAGLRLGFAITGPDLAARLAEALGPWPVSGPALHFGAEALLDRNWAEATRGRLGANRPRLRDLGASAGLAPQGGTGLFQSFLTPEGWSGAAAGLQAALARRRVWSRVWPERPRWIRLGAPGPEADWARLEAALSAAVVDCEAGT